MMAGAYAGGMPIPRVVGRWNKAGLNRVTRRVAPWAPGLGVVGRRAIRPVERQILRVLQVTDFLSLTTAPAAR